TSTRSTSTSGSSEAFSETGKAAYPGSAYPGSATSLPSLSDLFSFPGVPGVQSPPAIPGFPSPTPPPPSTEADLRKAHPLPDIPASGNVAGTEMAPQGTQKPTETTSVTSGFQPYEF